MKVNLKEDFYQEQCVVDITFGIILPWDLTSYWSDTKNCSYLPMSKLAVLFSGANGGLHNAGTVTVIAFSINV